MGHRNSLRCLFMSLSPMTVSKPFWGLLITLHLLGIMDLYIGFLSIVTNVASLVLSLTPLSLTS